MYDRTDHQKFTTVENLLQRGLADKLKETITENYIGIAVAEFEACHEFVLSPQIVLDLFNRTDVWRKPARFTEVMKLFETFEGNKEF